MSSSILPTSFETSSRILGRLKMAKEASPPSKSSATLQRPPSLWIQSASNHSLLSRSRDHKNARYHLSSQTQYIMPTLETSTALTLHCAAHQPTLIDQTSAKRSVARVNNPKLIQINCCNHWRIRMTVAISLLSLRTVHLLCTKSKIPKSLGNRRVSDAYLIADRQH